MGKRKKEPEGGVAIQSNKTGEWLDVPQEGMDEFLAPIVEAAREAERYLTRFVPVEGRPETAYRREGTLANFTVFRFVQRRVQYLVEKMDRSGNKSEVWLYPIRSWLTWEQNLALGNLYCLAEPAAEWFDANLPKEGWLVRKAFMPARPPSAPPDLLPEVPADLHAQLIEAIRVFLLEAETAGEPVGPLTEPMTNAEIGKWFDISRNLVKTQILDNPDYYHEKVGRRTRLRVANMPPKYHAYHAQKQPAGK